VGDPIDWGGRDSAPRAERAEILNRFEGQERSKAGWHMRSNTELEADPRGHPNRVAHISLVALPLFDSDGLLFAVIYGRLRRDLWSTRN
jgi:hypothetical protein